MMQGSDVKTPEIIQNQIEKDGKRDGRRRDIWFSSISWHLMAFVKIRLASILRTEQGSVISVLLTVISRHLNKPS